MEQARAKWPILLRIVVVRLTPLKEGPKRIPSYPKERITVLSLGEEDRQAIYTR